MTRYDGQVSDRTNPRVTTAHNLLPYYYENTFFFHENATNLLLTILTLSMFLYNYQALHRILSPSLRHQGPTSTRSPYNNLAESSPRTRRNRHHQQLHNHHHHHRHHHRQSHLLLPIMGSSQRHRRTHVNTSDCEDNSSGEDEFTQVNWIILHRTDIIAFS